MRDEEEQLIQVVDARGRVVAASDNVLDRPPIASLDDHDRAEVAVRFDGEEERLVAAAAEVQGAAVGTTVLVALSTEDVEESRRRTCTVGSLSRVAVTRSPVWSPP